METEKSNYFITIPSTGYWLSPTGVKKVEETYNATFMGAWTIKDKSGNWSETPVDIFYVSNPDTSKGHTNYFGMFSRDKHYYITDGSSAFSEPMVGMVTEKGEVIVSRYRHDCVFKDGIMIDGGRDYTRTSGGRQVTVTVVDGKFRFE